MCFDQSGDNSALNRGSLKLVDKFIYIGSSVSSAENDINTRLVKAWTAIDRQMVIWKSDISDKIKRDFFQAVVVSILVIGCTTLTLSKRIEKKLDGNWTRMLRALLNKFWKQHSTKQQLYGHRPSISKSIQIRLIRHSGYCWRSKDEQMSHVILWNPPTRTHKCRTTNLNLSTTVLYGHRM